MDNQHFTQKIRLRHFHALAAVAQQKSISAAAKSLSISQPALSKTLSELKQLCGYDIVIRHGQGVILTHEAQQLLPHAVQILNTLQHASDSLLTKEVTAVQVIRLAALTTVAMGILPKIIDAFHQRNPSIQLQVATLHNNVLLAALRAQEYDLGIGRLAQASFMDGLDYELLFKEKIKLVVNPTHPLLKGNVSLAAAMNWPVVISPEGTAPWRIAQRILESQHCQLPETRLETSSTSLARQLALNYHYVWFVPSGAVREDLLHQVLSALPLQFTDPGEKVGIITPISVSQNTTVDRLKTTIREQCFPYNERTFLE
ncbi:LysR family transcriptional regulator [Rosenbergiella australiborealis]|uniref:LysR family transcriptional regulator n=1 Tax=Rosenbergiella australiborealis TaxID=1544696 RepID=A0ABS5T3U1_9GAMM|nr:LysR family transcriptional regulator [Rosenbergiella australiborealis]